MTLTQAETKLVIAAIRVAINSEEDFIECHMKYGRTIDREITDKSKKFIRRMRRLQSRLSDLVYFRKDKP